MFHFGDKVVGPSSVQLPVGGGGTPCVSLVKGWVESGQDSRRLSYLSALMAEGLGFATAVHGTSVSPYVSFVLYGSGPLYKLWFVAFSTAL